MHRRKETRSLICSLIDPIAADATVRIWDLNSNKCLKILEGHLAGISTLAWSPDSRTIASGSDDKTIWLWNIATVSEWVN